MAEPALQYDEFENIEPIEIPAGGIATFLTAKEGMFADDDDIPQGGIAQVKAVADQLAEFGRHEDEYMVHAAHGETVIPMEVFRKNPILKENIYKQMRDMGLEPERYVVGSEFNSINPVTGQPEFFLKKLFKGIKKVFKVVAPIVLTAVLTPIVGPIYAGAITGGITSLAQGGSFKDALKMAAIGGATAGVFKGIQGAAGAAKSGGNIFTGAKEGFMAAKGVSPFAAGAATGPTQTATAVKSALEASVDAAPLDALGQVDPVTDSLTGAPVIRDPSVGPTTVTGAQFRAGPGAGGGDIAREFITPQSSLLPDAAGTPTERVGAGTATGTGTASQTTGSVTGVADGTIEVPGIRSGIAKLTGFGDAPFRPIQGLKDIFLPGMSQREIAASLVDPTKFTKGTAAFQAEVARIMKEQALQPSFFRKVAPGIIGILGVDALTRQEPQDFNVDEQVTGFDLYEQDPFRYSVGTIQPRPTNFKIRTLTQEDFGLPSTGSVYLPYAAEGGEIDENMFPRMNGPIEGPGTETSDDIPAMLSDGEFVMTAKAVRGAGNGSRQEGMKNMYQMMSNFEARA